MMAVKPTSLVPMSAVYPDKARIVSYMQTQKKTAIAPKYFHDPITDEPIDELDWREDSTFGWSSETTYLFDKYNYPLPDDFIAHVRAAIQ